jgi:N-acetylmuramoyl-L-alanine amidase
MKICVDPGHGMSNRAPGVFDPGATHTENGFQFREADIALSYGLKLKDVLRAEHHEVFMTRDDNTDHAPVSRRAKNAKDAGCEAFVSLHLNSAEDDDARGLEVLFRDDDELAREMKDELIEITGLRDRGIKKRLDLAVLKFNGPAILIELGFIGNDDDRAVLLNQAIREKICKGVAKILTA